MRLLGEGEKRARNCLAWVADKLSGPWGEVKEGIKKGTAGNTRRRI